MELEIGESVVLRADFKAHPKAVVTWLKDGLPLGNVTKYNVASSEIISVLHISNLQVTDTATYTVRTNNNIELWSISLSIYVGGSV